jgi:hypothetical protein
MSEVVGKTWALLSYTLPPSFHKDYILALTERQRNHVRLLVLFSQMRGWPREIKQCIKKFL